ncbi:exodeoxyribonuclease III [Kordiimonas sp. SCSIO 12610]|uniref:exodeoxyribonuclease III n=1 Tax=Kordiimonas sp. SCSIO 12610 TaxID=2829597 RepID=UPI00210C8064|nr:exodeoxyribonuclease III [Kordiimonas sp. SCSIO 12610]UTW54238.1 exodeoxyribonuclease III [Kordiimonas sp. SCSIO 12610]
MKIATFNINGIKARLPRLLEWLDEFSPDVACLQEIKSIDENFPRLEIEEKGWHVETHGQKSFNGVAFISKHPIENTLRGLPGHNGEPFLDDEQARYIEATIKGVRIASIYLPNGNPRPGPKFDYKLEWMDRLISHAKRLLETEQPVVLAGDYNVIPHDEDCYNPAAWTEDALTQPESRARLRSLINLGYLDAIRQINPVGPMYSYWDFQRGAWQKDNGIRIDHLLLSAQAADRLKDSGIDRVPRGKEKPSDHTPAWIELRD